MERKREKSDQIKDHASSIESNENERKKSESIKEESIHVPSLYVGDLSSQITENDLEKIFSQIGPIKHVKICKDIGTGNSLGYGFVSFEKLEDAEKAILKLNHYIHSGPGGKPLRIMWDYKDKKFHRSGDGNLFLKDLPLDINSKTLEKMFSEFGKILSCKVCTDEGGLSLGYGFINFENQRDAKEAILKTNGKIYGGKKIFVGPFLTKKERKVVKKKNFYTNIFIKNISQDDCNEKFINDLFGIFGKITSIFIHKNYETPGAIAFVNFENSSSAEDAIFRMNNKKIKNLTLYVGKGKNKFDRQRSLKKKFLIKKIGPIEKPIDSILIGCRIPLEIKDEKVISIIVSKEIIKNCKIFENKKGKKEKFCFIWFSFRKIPETKFGKNKDLLIKIEKTENLLVKNCLIFKKIYNSDDRTTQIKNRKKNHNNLYVKDRKITEKNDKQCGLTDRISYLLKEAKEKGRAFGNISTEKEKLGYDELKKRKEKKRKTTKIRYLQFTKLLMRFVVNHCSENNLKEDFIANFIRLYFDLAISISISCFLGITIEFLIELTNVLIFF